MENDVFSAIVVKVLDACESSLLGAKHSEYTRQKDRFHNFKEAGKKRNKHPIDILLDYQIKHTVSIEDICEDAMNSIYPTDEKLLEKIKDHINYNIMLFGMITELRQEARMDAMAEESRTMGVGEEIAHNFALESSKKFEELREYNKRKPKVPGDLIFHPDGSVLIKGDFNPLLDVAYQRDNDLHETINKVNSGLNADKQTGDI